MYAVMFKQKDGKGDIGMASSVPKGDNGRRTFAIATPDKEGKFPSVDAWETAEQAAEYIVEMRKIVPDLFGGTMDVEVIAIKEIPK